MIRDRRVNVAGQGAVVEPGADGLKDHVQMLWRRRWVVLLSGLVVFVGVLVVNRRAPLIYQAGVTLQIGQIAAAPFAGEFDALARSADQFMNELQILESRMLAERVVRALHPEGLLHPAPLDAPVSMTPILASPEARSGTFNVTFADSEGRFRVTDPEGELVGLGREGAPFQGGGLSFTISDARTTAGESLSFLIDGFQRAADGLGARSRATPVRATSVVSLTVESQDPFEAAREANGLAEAYIAYNVEWKRLQANTVRTFIGRQLDTLVSQLEVSGEALKDFKTTAGVVTIDNETRRRLEQLSIADGQRMDIERKRRQAEGNLRQIRQDTAVSPEDLRSLILTLNDRPDPTTSALMGRLGALEVELETLMARFTNQHESVVAVRAEIDGIRRQLINQATNMVEALREQEDVLGGLVTKYRDSLRAIPEMERGLASLRRNSAVNEDLYGFLLQRYEEARIAEASQQGDARVIDRATPSLLPVRPKVRRNLVVALIAGLMLGIALAYVWENFDRAIRTVEDVARVAGLTVYGIIPQHNSRRYGLGTPYRHQPGLVNGSRGLISIRRPRSEVGEAFRVIRTNLRFAQPASRSKTILITSPGPGEGKSETTGNLAVVLAQAGVRTLVIDADLRQPRMHELFGVPAGMGLADILAGTVAFKEVVRSTAVEALHLLPAGSLPPNPADLLGSERMSVLLVRLTERYDMILVDSPPTLLVTDGPAVGAMVDGVLLVVRTGRTTPKAISRALAGLEAVNAKVIGAILNGTGPEARVATYGRWSRYYEPPSGDDAQGAVEEESALLRPSSSADEKGYTGP